MRDGAKYRVHVTGVVVAQDWRAQTDSRASKATTWLDLKIRAPDRYARFRVASFSTKVRMCSDIQLCEAA